MQEIQLWQLLQYLSDGDDISTADRIQIVTGDREWNDYEELNVLSELLVPFRNWYVWDLHATESDIGGNEYCLRVEIRKEPREKKGA